MDLVRKSDVLKLIDSVEFDADADYYVDDILNDLRLWVQALEPVNAKKEVQKMPEYIRKQAVLNLIDDLEFGNAIAADYDNVHEFQKLYDAVEATQAADVAPVVHARWEAHEFGPIDAYKCSNCGLITINRNIPLLRYCVQCGARMDGEEQ